MEAIESESYSHLRLSKTQEKKRRRRKYPNVFFKKELVALFDNYEEPKTMIGAFLAFFCALRISEIAKLKWKDLDLVENRLKVIDGKNHKDGFVPISSVIIPILKKWQMMNPDEEYFLPEKDHNKEHTSDGWLLKSLKKSLKRAGLEIETEANAAGLIQHQYKFHTLRHSRCTHLLSNGVPVQKVQRFMRHDKIDTTLTYTWILDTELNHMVETTDKPSTDYFELPEQTKVQQNMTVAQNAPDAIDLAKKRLVCGEITVKEYTKMIGAMAEK